MLSPACAVLQDLNELVGLGAGKSGRGFVEDEDANLPPKGLGDLDLLPLADCQTGDRSPGIEVELKVVQKAVCARLDRSPVDPRSDPGSCPSARFSATVNGSTRFNSWWMMPIAFRSAAAGSWNRTGLPPISIEPESGRKTPPRIWISVLLPAPFSPQRA